MSKNKGPQPPIRYTELRRNLFENPADTFNLMSSGIEAVISNVEGHLQDAELLAEAKSYNTTDFLVGTAREEIGKLFILLDMCRIDFTRHQNIIVALCKAFYSHEKKHGYYELSHQSYPGIRNLQDAKKYFGYAIQRYWPTDPESGEPDMPHDSYFYREMNLYVDFIDYDQAWSEPNRKLHALRYEEVTFLGTPLGDVRKTLETLKGDQKLGMFSPEALEVLNRHFSSTLFTEGTDTQKLSDAYQAVSKDIEGLLGVPSERFEKSMVHNWPLYSFL